MDASKVHRVSVRLNQVTATIGIPDLTCEELIAAYATAFSVDIMAIADHYGTPEIADAARVILGEVLHKMMHDPAAQIAQQVARRAANMN